MATNLDRNKTVKIFLFSDGSMPNTGDCQCGRHFGAKQIKNMTAYERCSLVELIKFLRSRNAQISGRKADLSAS